MRCVSYKTDKLASLFGNLVYFSDSHTTCMLDNNKSRPMGKNSIDGNVVACMQTNTRQTQSSGDQCCCES